MAEAAGCKRGRPSGPSKRYMTQDAYGNIRHTHLSPFNVRRTRARAAGVQDLPDNMLDHDNVAAADADLDASMAGTLGTPEGAHQPPEGMSTPSSAALSDSPGAVQAEQYDLFSYARQLAGNFGADFRPVCSADNSTKQACFCVPDWNPATAALTAKRFHLPGLRLVTFADGDYLTWWCDCHHSLESARNMFANADFPNQPSDWLEGRAEMCLHLKALEASSSPV